MCPCWLLDSFRLPNIDNSSAMRGQRKRRKVDSFIVLCATQISPSIITSIHLHPRVLLGDGARLLLACRSPPKPRITTFSPPLCWMRNVAGYPVCWYHNSAVAGFSTKGERRIVEVGSSLVGREFFHSPVRTSLPGTWNSVLELQLLHTSKYYNRRIPRQVCNVVGTFPTFRRDWCICFLKMLYATRCAVVIPGGKNFEIAARLHCRRLVAGLPPVRATKR